MATMNHYDWEKKISMAVEVIENQMAECV